MRQATRGEVRLDADKAVRVNASVPSTASLDHLLLAMNAICCCPSKPIKRAILALKPPAIWRMSAES